MQAAPVPLEIPPVGIAPAHHDMGVQTAGVGVVDRNPVEFTVQVARQAGHDIARHVVKPVQLGCVIRRQHDPRLPRVAAGALDERIRSNAPAGRAVQRAGTAVRLDAVSPEIPEMRAGIGGPGRSETAQPDNAAALAGRMKPAATARRVRPPAAEVPERLDAAQEGCRCAAFAAEPRTAGSRQGMFPGSQRSDPSSTSRPARSDTGVGPWYRPSNDRG